MRIVTYNLAARRPALIAQANAQAPRLNLNSYIDEFLRFPRGSNLLASDVSDNPRYFLDEHRAYAIGVDTVSHHRFLYAVSD